jgi:hypothetical protein
VCTGCRLPCVYAGGEYEASPCTATADRTCGTCSTAACPSETYKSAACSTTADRVCSACTKCSASQWQTSACTATSNRTCATCSTCPAGQYQTAACTTTTNTTCVGCAACSDANSTRQGCGGTSPGSCVCNSGYKDLGTGRCYKMATITNSCPSGYTVSGSQCQKNPVNAGYQYICPKAPSGITYSSGNGCRTSGCCKYTTIVSYTCPSGGTPTIIFGNYYCV